MPDSSQVPRAGETAGTQRLFERVFAQSNDFAFVLMDGDGRIVAWRGAAATIFGYSEPEMLGRPIDEIFTDGDRRLGLPLHERSVAAADGRSEDDRWHVRKDGTRVWMTGTVEAIRDGEGTIIGFSKVMRDRTDLRAHMESLENRVQAQMRARERTNVFLARLVHEVRNVLQPIGANIELLRRLADSEPLLVSVDGLRRQLALLVRIADDVMALAASESGHLQLTLSELDVLVHALGMALHDADVDALHMRDGRHPYFKANSMCAPGTHRLPRNHWFFIPSTLLRTGLGFFTDFRWHDAGLQSNSAVRALTGELTKRANHSSLIGAYWLPKLARVRVEIAPTERRSAAGGRVYPFLATLRHGHLRTKAASHQDPGPPHQLLGASWRQARRRHHLLRP